MRISFFFVSAAQRSSGWVCQHALYKSTYLLTYLVVGACAERIEVGGADAEADQSREAARAIQGQPRAGDTELQGGGDEAAQDHLPAGERP